MCTLPPDRTLSPPAQPRLKHTRFGFKEHVPWYGGRSVTLAQTVTPTSSPTNLHVRTKYKELRAKACAGQLLLNPHDLDLYKMLHRIITSVPDTQKPIPLTMAGSATNISLNMPSILLFTHIKKDVKHHFHKDTNNTWSKAATHKPAQAKMIIKIELDKLIRKDASFSFCIHAQLLKTLVKVNFEPGDMYSPKPLWDYWFSLLYQGSQKRSKT